MTTWGHIRFWSLKYRLRVSLFNIQVFAKVVVAALITQRVNLDYEEERLDNINDQ